MKLKLVNGEGRGASRTIVPIKREAPELRIVLPAECEYQDLLMHREDLVGFRIEVWRVGASRGTAAPKFYYLRFNLVLTKPKPCRSSREFKTAEQALACARNDARRWRRLIDRRPAGKRPRRRCKEAPLRREPERLEALELVADICRHGDPLCPVCSQQVNVPRIAGMLRATGTAY